MKYALICLIVFAILTFLKFCEGSPLRSWKSVVLAGIPLSFIICYYVSHAFLTPPPPPPHSEKIAANLTELERNLRHIAGVRQANIEGHEVLLDLAENKPVAKLRKLALQIAGTAAFYLELGKTNQLTVLMTVNGRNRYKLVYSQQRHIVNQTTF